MASKKSKSKKLGKKRKLAVRKKKHPPGPVVMATVVDKRGRIFTAILRTGSVKKGFRGLPHGRIDPGESPLRAVKRELWEETRMKARFIGKPDVYYYGRGSSRVRVHNFIGHRRGQPKDTPEMHRHQWRRPEKFMADPNAYPRARHGIGRSFDRIKGLAKKHHK